MNHRSAAKGEAARHEELSRLKIKKVNFDVGIVAFLPMRIALVTNEKMFLRIHDHSVNKSNWSKWPPAEMRIGRKLEKLLSQIQCHFRNKSNWSKWPPAEMRIGRVTCLAFQLSHRDILRFFVG